MFSFPWISTLPLFIYLCFQKGQSVYPRRSNWDVFSIQSIVSCSLPGFVSVKPPLQQLSCFSLAFNVKLLSEFTNAYCKIDVRVMFSTEFIPVYMVSCLICNYFSDIVAVSGNSAYPTFFSISQNVRIVHQFTNSVS